MASSWEPSVQQISCGIIYLFSIIVVCGLPTLKGALVDIFNLVNNLVNKRQVQLYLERFSLLKCEMLNLDNAKKILIYNPDEAKTVRRDTIFISHYLLIVSAGQ